MGDGWSTRAGAGAGADDNCIGARKEAAVNFGARGGEPADEETGAVEVLSSTRSTFGAFLLPLDLVVFSSPLHLGGRTVCGLFVCQSET